MMSQITQCPACNTTFKVVPDQLRIANGWVRCGHCRAVFDASQLLQQLPAQAVGDAAPLSSAARTEALAPPVQPVSLQPAALPSQKHALVTSATVTPPPPSISVTVPNNEGTKSLIQTAVIPAPIRPESLTPEQVIVVQAKRADLSPHTPAASSTIPTSAATAVTSTPAVMVTATEPTDPPKLKLPSQPMQIQMHYAGQPAATKASLSAATMTKMPIVASPVTVTSIAIPPSKLETPRTAQVSNVALEQSAPPQTPTMMLGAPAPLSQPPISAHSPSIVAPLAPPVPQHVPSVLNDARPVATPASDFSSTSDRAEPQFDQHPEHNRIHDDNEPVFEFEPIGDPLPSPASPPPPTPVQTPPVTQHAPQPTKSEHPITPPTPPHSPSRAQWGPPAPATPDISPGVAPVLASAPTTLELPARMHDEPRAFGDIARQAQEDQLDQLGFVRQAQRKSFWQRLSVRLVLSLIALLALLGLLVQWAIQERDMLAARDPRIKPLLQTICQHAGCEVHAPRNIDAIEIDGSSFSRIQNNDFELSISLKSSANYPIVTPSIELTLTDAQDQLLLRRVLRPKDIGAPEILPSQGEWAGHPVITASTPGGSNTAPIVGYRVLAFYP